MKKFFFLLAAVLTVLAAKAANEVYTSYNDATKTLTYYFDDQREVRQAAGETTELYDPEHEVHRFITYHNDILKAKIDVSMQNANLTTMQLMFSGGAIEGYTYSLNNMTEIEGMENLVTDNVTNMSSMFSRCRSLQSVDLSRFNTANVTNMASMFNTCESLQMLDLCSFNTSKVINMTAMFSHCEALERICSNTDWSQTSTALLYSEYMFDYCNSLIGCAGTTFADAQVLDIQYARPDGGTDAPGYFTPKQNEIYTVYYNGYYAITYYYDDQRHFREGITEVYDPSHPEKPRFKDYWDALTVVNIDESMKNADLTSTSCMFMGGSPYEEEFYNLKNVKFFIGLENLVTDNVTDMSNMFYGCNNLERVNVSSFNTANVERMENMFYECYKLASLDLSHFNTAKVTNMSCMFQSCSTLTELDVSSFNTANVTDMSFMFSGCSGLDSLGLTSFNTAKVKSMSCMFWRCSNLRVVDIHSFSIASLTNAPNMFDGCGELLTIYCNGDWSQSELLVNSEKMFKDCIKLCSTREDGTHGTCYTQGVDRDKNWARPDKNGARGYFTPIKEVYVEWDAETKTLTWYYDALRSTRTGIIAFCRNEIAVIPIGFSWEDVEKAVIDASFANFPLTTLSGLFLDFYNLKEVVGLNNFNTENVTDMSYMFANCFLLETIDLSSLNTANVTKMSNMFLDCKQLKDVKLTNLNTSNVTDFDYMFHGCSSLTELELNNFDVSHATTFQGMFCYCASLKTIMCQDDWNIGDIESSSMFRDCNALVGGKGTICDSSTDPGLPFAHPDGGEGHPGYFTIPTGELHRFFTINSNGDKVVFSKGNLQYNSGTWRFADNQWEHNCDGWQTKFGWGTGDDPTSTASKPEFVDWGTNAITKGAMEPGYWRTVTRMEWNYILTKRDNYLYLKGKATVNGVQGTILLPDYWSTPEGLDFSPTMVDYSKTYTADQWTVMEAAGAVFIPIATGTIYYWSSDAKNSSEAYKLNTTDGSEGNYDPKTTQFFVRLVRDTVVPQPEPVEAYETLEPYTGEVKEIGVFSIGDAKKVTFSQGNLQYKASADTYRFAENQYDTISRADNKRIGINSTLWIDHFGWGTGDRPYLYTYEDKKNSRYPTFVDWGTNPIWNGGNEPGQWRTLTGEEWHNLLEVYRPVEKYRSRGTVEGIPGFIILPDDWVKPDDINISTGNPGYTSNIYNAEQWSKLEQAGAVFLPAAGYRYFKSDTKMDISSYLTAGYYWAATDASEGQANRFMFETDGWNPGQDSQDKKFGMCVRLVKDLVVEPVPTDEETTFDFSAIDEKGTEVLGILLSDKDTYNEDENRVEITKTNKQDSIELVLNKEWDGEIAPKTFLPGTINFELEPGERDIEIDCQTKPGYTIRVHLAEYGEAHITATVEQAARGKATVHYKATKNTYVVIYLYNESTSSSAPLRMARAKAEGDMDAGAYIYSIKIVPFIPMDITAKQDPDDSGNYYSTFYDSAKNYALPNDGTEAYTAKIDADGNMVLTLIAENDQVIPANTAVILKATTPSFALTPSVNTPVSVPAGNELLGVDEPTAAPANCYVLSGHSKDNAVQGVGFYLFTGTLAAHKAYILYNGSTPLAPSHRMRFVFSEEQTATGIDEMEQPCMIGQKVLIHGHLYIIRNGLKYDAQGQIVK